MIAGFIGTASVEEVACTVEVEHSFESLHAHVTLHGGAPIGPGDEVTVQGPRIEVPFGQTAVFERRAVIKRASGLERFWTRLTGDFEFMELCEFSFSSGDRL